MFSNKRKFAIEEKCFCGGKYQVSETIITSCGNTAFISKKCNRCGHEKSFYDYNDSDKETQAIIKKLSIL